MSHIKTSIIVCDWSNLKLLHTSADSLSSSNCGGGHVGRGGGEVGGEETDVSGSDGRYTSEAIESGRSSLAMAGWAGTNHPTCCRPSLAGFSSDDCFFIAEGYTRKEILEKKTIFCWMM